jgi:NAD(P)-dependent dehydrogenase (short-subunit alcohol dehydrogenase family)
MMGDARDDAIVALAKRIPLRRIAEPEEVAHAIRFLMTNSYVTGSTVTIDGGFSIA